MHHAQEETGAAPFRVGLVGAGHICEFHIAALRRLGHVKIVGVTDINAERLQQTAQQFNLSAYPSLDALCEAGANVIHVLTPPHTHASVTLAALERNCHVLVEKPLATDADAVRAIQQVARDKKCRVCVNHSLLFDPQVRAALHAVQSGRIGKLVSVDILRSSVYPPFGEGPTPPQYQTAGYPFRDIGVHALYLFQAFLGPIESVQADWASLGGDVNLAFDEWRAQVRCRDGMGQFQLSWNVKPVQSQIILQGTKGVLRVDLFLMFQALRAQTAFPKSIERVVNAFSDSLQPMVDVPRNAVRFLRGVIRPYHGLQDLVAAFYNALLTGEAVPASPEDALPVVEWTERVARAADADFGKRRSQFALSPHVQVLVTGASGALGSAIVARLRASGISRVRVLMRRAPEIADGDAGVEYAFGDLGDAAAVDKAVDGAEVVIHAGAAMSGQWIEHHRATVIGTQNVLDACVRRNTKKLIYISSFSVVDWAGSAPSAVMDENSPLEPRAQERGFYTQAKLDAEQLVTQYVQNKQLPAVILRPGQIFGGRIPLLTPALARSLGKNRWLVLGDGNLQLPLVYMEDVVDAVLLAMRTSIHSGEIIHIVDEQKVTQNDVLRHMIPHAKIVRLPRPAVFAAGRLSEVLLGAMKRQSPFSVYRLQSAMARRNFEARRGCELLGWSPHVGVWQAMEQIKHRTAASE